MDGLIRQVVSVDDSQFGFVPGRGTTDAIFVVRQLQEKYPYFEIPCILKHIFFWPNQSYEIL